MNYIIAQPSAYRGKCKSVKTYCIIVYCIHLDTSMDEMTHASTAGPPRFIIVDH